MKKTWLIDHTFKIAMVEFITCIPSVFLIMVWIKYYLSTISYNQSNKMVTPFRQNCYGENDYMHTICISYYGM